MTAVVIGVWALLGALFIGWLLWRLDRWSARSVDAHVEDALAQATRRERDRARHPSQRARRVVETHDGRRGHMPAGRTVVAQCRSCGELVRFGPVEEHVCRGAW